MEFKHMPLKDPASSIRVVNILPAGPDHIVRCAVKYISRDTEDESFTESYDALSYMWGSEDVLFDIKINGMNFKVRQILHEFLKYAQVHRSEQNIWIDAICIDQEDTVERNQQVQQMGRIYKHASSVLVYSNVQLQHPEAVVETFIVAPKLPDARAEDVISIAYAKKTHLVGKGTLSETHAVTLFQSDTLQVFEHAYWERFWVMQEVILANENTMQMLLGTIEVRWADFSLFAIKHMSFIMLSSTPKFPSYNMTSLVRSKVQDDVGIRSGRLPGWDIEVSLSMSEDSKRADIRDHVFGILSFTNSGSLMKVDYSMTVTEIFYETIMCFGRLDSFHRIAKRVGRVLELPDFWNRYREVLRAVYVQSHQDDVMAFTLARPSDSVNKWAQVFVSKAASPIKP